MADVMDGKREHGRRGAVLRCGAVYRWPSGRAGPARRHGVPCLPDAVSCLTGPPCRSCRSAGVLVPGLWPKARPVGRLAVPCRPMGTAVLCHPLACSKLAAELETTTVYGDWRSRWPQKRETEREEVTSQATMSPWGLGPERERGARGAGAVARRAHSQVRHP